MINVIFILVIIVIHSSVYTETTLIIVGIIIIGMTTIGIDIIGLIMTLILTNVIPLITIMPVKTYTSSCFQMYPYVQCWAWMLDT